jgi:uracil-DNA glycosylase
VTGQLVFPGAGTLELPPVEIVVPTVEQLLAALATTNVGATYNFYNFYAGEDPAAGERRERLRRYLHARWTAAVVLVGEAAGYQGARLSGIPFTSEHQLLGHGRKEPAATVVHRVLGALGVEADVLLWNAVPFHPHPPGNPWSNRPPTSTEVLGCRSFLEAVCRGRRVVAVGRVAAAAIRQANLGTHDVPYVRHPSHGGARQFEDGLARLLPGDAAAGAATTPRGRAGGQRRATPNPGGEP